jgi:hypothetical protein
MSAPDQDRAPDGAEPATGFGQRVVVVLAVQLATLAALYLFGRYFA